MEESTQNTIFYEYDEIDQLVAVKYPDGTVIRYQYDALGNRTQTLVDAPQKQAESAPVPEVEEGNKTIIRDTGADKAGTSDTVRPDTMRPARHKE
jgi:YD repeat-containing protein